MQQTITKAEPEMTETLRLSLKINQEIRKFKTGTKNPIRLPSLTGAIL